MRDALIMELRTIIAFSALIWEVDMACMVIGEIAATAAMRASTVR
ncbi:hypothetical protein WEI85_42895 [Actinomycetes bacterium KLBMP 9797]